MDGEFNSPPRGPGAEGREDTFCRLVAAKHGISPLPDCRFNARDIAPDFRAILLGGKSVNKLLVMAQFVIAHDCLPQRRAE